MEKTFNVGDVVNCWVKNIALTKEFVHPGKALPEHTKLEGIIIAVDHKAQLCLFVLNDQTEISKSISFAELDDEWIETVKADPSNKFIDNFMDYKGKHAAWRDSRLFVLAEKKIEAAKPMLKNGFDGCRCNNCGNFEQYAAADENGIFVCYSCKQNPYRKSSLGHVVF